MLAGVSLGRKRDPVPRPRGAKGAPAGRRQRGKPGTSMGSWPGCIWSLPERVVDNVPSPRWPGSRPSPKSLYPRERCWKAQPLATGAGFDKLRAFRPSPGQQRAPRRMTPSTDDPNRRRGLRQALDQLGVDSPALWWSLLYFFCLLTGYYVLRPVREAMAASSDIEAIFPRGMIAFFADRGVSLG